MNPISYHRLARTPYSEQYELVEGGSRLAYLDIHYTQTNVFATLVLDRELSEDETAQVVDSIDDDLVESAEVTREDFFVRVFVGRQVDEYSDVLRQEEEIAVDAGEPFDLN